MEKRSRYSYAETLDRLSKAITGAGNTIFITIDQARAAADVGLTLRPTSLIIFGNPKGGTPLMDVFPPFALELPLKFLVWEEQGQARVAYSGMADTAKRYGVPSGDPRIAAMDHALDALSNSVV